MGNNIDKALVVHSLFWWLLGNVIGALLSLLVLFPSLNSILAPATYGRLVPLHLNFQLYGWNAMPMIALLFSWYLPTPKMQKSAIWFWSISLAIGGVSWLLGQTSGKLFLEWQGLAKNIFVFNLFYLWLVVAKSFYQNFKGINLIETFKLIFLFFLGAIPFVMNFALRQDIFPPINTQSSGATGASLLISSLGVVGVFLLAPIILKLKSKGNLLPYFVALILHILAWLVFLEHGHSSQHQISQVLGLSSMLIWIPLLFYYFRQFSWPETLWLKSFAFWGVLLVIDASITFLPGILEFAKFTNLLVAHVHIAMAGMTTSFAMVLLSSVVSKNSLLNQKRDFLFWQIGLFVHLVSLFVIGFEESRSYYYLLSEKSDFAFYLRLLSGLMMTYSSLVIFLRVTKENEI